MLQQCGSVSQRCATCDNDLLQADLVKALATRANGLPLVVVLMHGGGFDIDWMQKLPTVNAILAVGFPGQVGLSAWL